MSRRSPSFSRSPPPKSPSPPSQTHHTSIIPRTMPTPALVESVAGGAHYSGVKVDHESSTQRRSSHDRRLSHTTVKHDHTRILDDLEELYCCRPRREIFDRTWNKDAVFEDPLSKCTGFQEYAAQWYAMPKFFSKSETISRRVLSSTLSPNRLVFSQKQAYTFRLFGHKKIVESIVVVDFDDDEKIVKLVDQWNGEEPPTRFGAHFLRRMNAKVFPWLVKVPKQDPPSEH